MRGVGFRKADPHRAFRPPPKNAKGREALHAMAGAGLNRPDPDPAPAQAGRGARLGGAICRPLRGRPGTGRVTNLKSAAERTRATAPKPRGSGAGLPQNPISDCMRGRHAAAAAFCGGVRHWLFARTSAAQAGVPPPVRPRGLTKLPRSIVIRNVGESCSCRGEPKRSVRGCRGRPLIRILPPRGMPSRRRRGVAPDRLQRTPGNFARGVSGRAQYRICRGAIRCVCTFFLHLGISGPPITAPSPGADSNCVGGRCPTAVMRPCARCVHSRGAVARKRGPALPVPRAIVGRVPRFSARCLEPSHSRFK